jgi:apolipoprotein N-acyltransferase
MQTKYLLLPLAMILTTIATLSRAAMGAMFLEIVVLLWLYKKELRSYIYMLFIVGIGAGIGLFSWKR